MHGLAPCTLRSFCISMGFGARRVERAPGQHGESLPLSLPPPAAAACHRLVLPPAQPRAEPSRLWHHAAAPQSGSDVVVRRSLPGTVVGREAELLQVKHHGIKAQISFHCRQPATRCRPSSSGATRSRLAA